MTKRIRILLADDHVMIIDGLKAVLQLHPDLVVCGTAANGAEAVALTASLMPDVLVLDINMPVMDGITCARNVKTRYPQVKIIVLTMYAQQSIIEQLIGTGVDGCLLKSNSGSELTEAILRVVSGRAYFDQVHAFQSTREEVGSYKFSDREKQIIRLIAEGNTSLQIADKLFIAEHTVKTHRKNILRKAGMHNTSQLIQFAINNKLL